MEEALSSTNTSTQRTWIAEQARRHPERVFNSLHHLIDLDWMREAYRRTRKDGAPGIDGVTAADCEQELETDLNGLPNRIKSGSYHAPPVRRHCIPKADGRQRPPGIPTLEDKVAQRAVVMLLEPVFEADFPSCSYGFRPGRSACEALDALYQGIARQGQVRVIDADIQGYFDNIPHTRLRGFLDLRIKDGVIRRMIDKWLRAGVLEDGVPSHSQTGTPQGGVISPLMANYYLHHVLDRWFAEAAQPRLRGGSRLVLYADDFVPAFADAGDGRRVLAVPGKRLARYGLTLHATETHYVDFRPPQGKRGRGTPTRFDFPGFTHAWGRSGRGNRVVRQLTAKGRYARALKAVAEWCKKHRHAPLDARQRHPGSVIRGHCNYCGLTGNGKRLSQYRCEVACIWRRWLSRRSRKSRINRERMQALLKQYPLPPAKVVRSIYAT